VALSRTPIPVAKYVAIAASLVIVAELGFIVVRQRERSQMAAAMVETAAGDHRDCALEHRLEEKSIDLDEAGGRYDRAYINLVNAVMAEGRLPAGVELVEAHSCVFKNRRFGHVILRYRDQLVSVLVTSIDPRDHSGSTEVKDVHSDGFQINHFETTRHAVYVVSGLSETQNRSIAEAIEPLLSRHIRDAERVA